jgi:hypothetical protein
MLNGYRDRAARAVAVMALAWGGTILGHLSSYVLAYPAHGSRAGHLRATGHGSFRAVMLTAAAALAVGVGLTVLRSIRPRSTFVLRRLALTLGAIQVLAFAFLETAERGFDPGAAAADPAVLMGLVLQVVVALLLSLAVVGLARSVRAIFVRRRITGRRASAPRAPSPAPFVDLLVFLRARPLRGPPLPLGS